MNEASREMRYVGREDDEKASNSGVIRASSVIKIQGFELIRKRKLFFLISLAMISERQIRRHSTLV
jgi:hypothetical protein